MEPFKNLLGYEAAKKIAKALKNAEPSFDESAFLLGLEKKLAPLELKDRMLELTARLKQTLPKNQKESFEILIKALQSNAKNKYGISGFLVWPFTQYVADEGLSHFELSMETLREMTQVFTGEWAIRAFLVHNEQKTLKQMAEWAQDANEHVRRLASEGSRPLLPWGQKLYAIVEDPEKTWPILEKLKNDSSLYVRKSVANHLNDHSKNHGDWVIKKLTSWKNSKSTEAEVDWIIRHATRTLVKKGHTGALSLHGIKPTKIKITQEKIKKPNIKLGQTLEVEVTLKNLSRETATVIIDHEISFIKANQKHSPKVFKGTKKNLKPNETIKIVGRIPLKKVTTRKYYFGKQFWAPIINGKKGKALAFSLKK